MRTQARNAHPRYGITALQRGLALLGLVGASQEALTASEIVSGSGLHASTVHRMLANLEYAGFLVRDERTHRYHLGPLCITLGRAALDRLDVRRICLPYLEEINRLTRESVHLTVRQGAQAVYVEKLEALEPLRIVSQVGASIPLHCTATGKVLLAFAGEEERAELLPQLSLHRATPRTIISLQQLQAELERVRRQRYALDLQENESHICCIAGGVWDHAGQVRAAFSITGPAARMTRQRLRELAPLVVKTSREISAVLGHTAAAAAPAPERRRLRA